MRCRTRGERDERGGGFIIFIFFEAPSPPFSNLSYDYNGRMFKFGFVGSAARCPSACAAQSNASPNGNVEADAMASIIAHELTETTSDPELDAWFDDAGLENADKCAWQFGPGVYAAKGGGYANTRIGARDFLLQLNWANRATAGYCDNK